MSPYLSDCMPDERVAIQPPSVEWAKLSGKWPSVQPRAFSCSSSAGPNAPAWTSASARPASMRARGRAARGRRRRPCAARRPAPRGCRRCSCRRRTGSRPRRRRAPRAGPPRPPPRRPGGLRRPGSRPSSPRRWRTRSRRLLPRAWTTRSIGSLETRSAPTAAASAPRARNRGTEAGPRAPRTARAARRTGDVDLQVALDERAQGRLVHVRERGPLVAPAPPLHTDGRYGTGQRNRSPKPEYMGHGGRQTQSRHRAGAGAHDRDQGARTGAQGANARAQGARARARQRAAERSAGTAHPQRRARAPVRQDGRLLGALRLRPRRSARGCSRSGSAR